MAKIKITQTGSPIRRDKTQRATLVGLGLNKLHRTVEVEGTPEVLGQVRKVQHPLAPLSSLLGAAPSVLLDRRYFRQIKLLPDSST